MPDKLLHFLILVSNYCPAKKNGLLKLCQHTFYFKD